MTDLRTRIFIAIASARPSQQADAVLEEIGKTHVLVERWHWDRVRQDYDAAISIAFEKDKYLQTPGATVSQIDLDRWRSCAERRWNELAVKPVENNQIAAER